MTNYKVPFVPFVTEGCEGNFFHLGTMIITINNKQYKVKYTIRALFIFEQITGKPFNISTLFDNYLFFYCLILANNPENVLDFEEYIDAVDSDKGLYQQLTKAVEEYQKQDNLLSGDDEEGGQKKS